MMNNLNGKKDMIFLTGFWRGEVWEIAGAYDNEEDAVNSVYDPEFFVMPVEKNKKLGDKTTIVGYYPMGDANA